MTRLRTQLALCAQCAEALGELSAEQDKHLALYAAKHIVPAQEAPKVSGLSARIKPQMDSSLVDKRVPTPETVLAFRQLGWSAAQIADLFDITVSQTRRLITAANRESLHETARDFIYKQFIPKALANIDRALDTDASAEISLQLADKLGLLAGSAASRPPGGDESSNFEEYRLEVIKRRSSTHPTSPVPALDPSPVIDVSVAEPARAALPSAAGRGSSDEALRAGDESPRAAADRASGRGAAGGE